MYRGEKYDTQTFTHFFRSMQAGEYYPCSRAYEYGPASGELCYSRIGKLLWNKAVLRDVHAVTKVRVGTNVSFGISRFPEMLSEFSKQYPQIPLYTRVENSRQIEQHLMRNELDFGIMDYPLNPRFFVCHPVGKDILTAVCACSYEIRNRVTLE